MSVGVSQPAPSAAATSRHASPPLPPGGPCARLGCGHPRVRRGCPGQALGGQQAGWMCAITTSCSLPRAAAIATGRHPSQAAKWGGCGPAGQVREGVARAPGTVPLAPLVGSLLPTPLRGLCLGTGSLAQPRGGASRCPSPLAVPVGHGERVPGGPGTLGVPVAQGSTWCMLASPHLPLAVHHRPPGLWVESPMLLPLPRGLCNLGEPLPVLADHFMPRVCRVQRAQRLLQQPLQCAESSPVLRNA